MRLVRIKEIGLMDSLIKGILSEPFDKPHGTASKRSRRVVVLMKKKLLRNSLRDSAWRLKLHATYVVSMRMLKGA